MNNLDLKEGQTYICTDTKYRWWTEGKEYTVVLTEYGTPVLVDDEGGKWFNPQLSEMSTDFKLKTDDSEQKYTPFEVTKVIIKAYQLYDNDSQRLAYIKGYFDK